MWFSDRSRRFTKHSGIMNSSSCFRGYPLRGMESTAEVDSEALNDATAML